MEKNKKVKEKDAGKVEPPRPAKNAQAQNKNEATVFKSCVVNNGNESLSSVKISRNSKGTTFEVKCYDDDITKARDLAKALYHQLDCEFPREGTA